MNRARKKIFIFSALVFSALFSLEAETYGRGAFGGESDKKPEATRPVSGQAGGGNAPQALVFAGQDLNLAGAEVISCQLTEDEYSLVFSKGFSMSIGGNSYSSDSAVVWLRQQRSDFVGQRGIDIKVTVYLRDKIKVEKSDKALTAGLKETVIEKGKKEIVVLTTSGEVFVTADKRETSDNRQMEIYKEAFEAVSSLPKGPKFVVRPEAMVPQLPAEKPAEKIAEVNAPAKPIEQKPATRAGKPVVKAGGKKAAAEAIKPIEPIKPAKERVTAAEEKGVHFRYPVSLAPAGETSPQIEKFTMPDGTEAATVIGRIYVWQKQSETGRLLELQADNAVVFYGREKAESAGGQGRAVSIVGGSSIQAIYMSGDVTMTEGVRTIRAKEIYYDFDKQKAVAINSEIRTFDVERNIPIYIRAAKMRQLAADRFEGHNVVVTSSEFYRPQISLMVADANITDTTPVDQEEGNVSDESFDIDMRDVRMKYEDTTIFRWPMMQSNAERPDVSIRRLDFSNDNIWGTSLETQWYLSRLLGLKEPPGTNSIFDLDYHSKRGVGTGAEIDYDREQYFGRIIGYIIDDHGEDRLGNLDSRQNLKPPDDLRGRFQVQNRTFLPYNWQLTTELAYLSDEHFLEAYYRHEFDTGKEQETLVQLKRLEDNWAVSILAKARINDFADELEELPSFEYHRTGESLFNDTFTLYSDTTASRLRQQVGEDHSLAINGNEFAFVSHRTELDLPLRFDTFKIVPYAAGTFGYDDRSGFTKTLVDGSNSGSFGDDEVWIAESGVRMGTEFWKVYPSVQSRLWDVNGLRHIVTPQVTGVAFDQSNLVVQQHDMLNVDILQRLQTKRGTADNQQTVDWMRLDTQFTFVKDPAKSSDIAPNQFIWNQPMVPLRVFSAPQIFNDDLQSGLGLQRVENFGPQRNYFGEDYIWRVSDTFAISSDGYYDMQSGVLDQFDIGLSRLVWPNLSYYIGTRYLNHIDVLGEKSSNAFIFSMTYEIDPRYTLVFAQQYDFSFGTNMRSDISLVRRYQRLFYGVTFSSDRTLGSQSVVFSIWPQGIPELATGPRKYDR